jgi:hypothetical protein
MRRQWSSGDYPSPEPAAWLPLPPCDTLPGFRRNYNRTFREPWLKRAWYALPVWMRNTLRPFFGRYQWKRRWVRMPGPVRTVLRPVLTRMRWLLKQFS